MITLIVGLVLFGFGAYLFFERPSQNRSFTDQVGEGCAKYTLAPVCVIAGIICFFIGYGMVEANPDWATNMWPQFFLGLKFMGVGALLFGAWRFLLRDNGDAVVSMFNIFFGILVCLFGGASLLAIGALMSLISLIVIAFQQFF